MHAKTGLVTFHAPVGASACNPFPVHHFRRTVVADEALVQDTPKGDDEVPVPKRGRTVTICCARVHGPLVGGNLAALNSMAGSHDSPRFDGAILMLEDVNEYSYRVDRMPSMLKIAGVLDRVAGVLLGAFTSCEPGEGYGTLALDEVFDDYFKDPGVPASASAQFGHITKK